MTNMEWLNTLTPRQFAGLMTGGIYVIRKEEKDNYPIPILLNACDFCSQDRDEYEAWLISEQEYEVTRDVL